jgi:tungstate transport system ATP-binding protein
MLLGLLGNTRLLGRGPILPLELHGVGFHAGGQRLLADLEQRFEAGGISVILGPNGAGKSLLLRVCHGLLQPSCGQVTWANEDARTLRFGQVMVFQRPVHLRRSVRANLDFALRARGVAQPERRRRLAQALEDSRLTAFAKRAARTLSGGEQQRLALARAWALRPEVLFLDEPTANLDPASTRDVEGMIAQIRDAGAKVVMTTHALDQARRLAEEVLFLYRGRVLERRAADAFFAEPLTTEAKAFVQGRLLW